ncbi:MAG: c-type cytochrome [Gemmatimonadales bacterium]
MRLTLLVLMIAATACHGGQHRSGVTAVDTALVAPDGSPVPGGEMGRSIRRGRAILAATGDSLPDHVGNGLRCVSCHLSDGRRPDAIPFTGVYARYPAYRSRSASIQQIEDRINGCFQRSMAGTPLAFDDPGMRDIVNYFAFLSRGIPVGDTTPGLEPETGLSGDSAAGAQVFTLRCARCHGADGAGRDTFPAVWGPRSFTIGAGMARIRTLTGFIHHNMPRDSAGVLTDAEALNVAAYISSQPRPDYAGKEHDWPLGDAPPDVPYPTLANPRKR